MNIYGSDLQRCPAIQLGPINLSPLVFTCPAAPYKYLLCIWVHLDGPLEKICSTQFLQRELTTYHQRTTFCLKFDFISTYLPPTALTAEWCQVESWIWRTKIVERVSPAYSSDFICATSTCYNTVDHGQGAPVFVLQFQAGCLAPTHWRISAVDLS